MSDIVLAEWFAVIPYKGANSIALLSFMLRWIFVQLVPRHHGPRGRQHAKFKVHRHAKFKVHSQVELQSWTCEEEGEADNFQELFAPSELLSRSGHAD